METSWKRNLALFLVSQTLSLFGSSLVQYAILWYIVLETRSGVIMTVYIVCGFVPAFILSPFAGVWADRYDRRKIIMLSDALIALVTLALALVFLSGHRALWLLIAAAAVRAVGTALQQPAVGAFIPQIVPEERLMRVNGINGTIQSAIMLASPAVSGLLMSLTPLYTLFFVDVVTAALAISIILFLLRVPPHAKALEKQDIGYLADMRLGFAYIQQHRYLVTFFMYMAILMFLITPAAFLTPLQVARTYGTEVWRLTAIEMLFSGGMMLGGGLISVWGGLPNRIKTMLLSHAIMAACTVGLGLMFPFWLYLTVMAVFGVALPFFNTPATVLIQEHVEPDFLGRVFSILVMINTAIMPLGMLIFGPLAEVVSIEWILIATGAALIVMAGLMPLNKRLLAAGAPKQPSASDHSMGSAVPASAGDQ